jgi:dihydroorotate dehydrogenase (fumarate)
MANLSTRFFGLELKSPVIAASCSMTGSHDQIKKIAQAGAGAIVLKSIFEEEIYLQLQEELKERSTLISDPEYLDYFDYVIREENLDKQIRLIKQAKADINLPIIASINCISSSEWTLFARKLQDAGADAIELNLFIIPSDVAKSNDANEQFYFETIRKVLEVITIPVTVKISHYFSNLAAMIKKLSLSGIAGITLFNRFYAPDIDTETQQLVSAGILSAENEYLLPLRWTGIMAPKTGCPLAATTGIHSAETAVKFLLAGASAVQVASVLYREGPDAICRINQGISDWMKHKGYQSIDEFKGKLSIQQKNAIAYERVQFMNWTRETSF